MHRITAKNKKCRGRREGRKGDSGWRRGKQVKILMEGRRKERKGESDMTEREGKQRAGE